MPRVRFLMIGGFLGAGKTTAIARVARHYIQHGQNVGLVTNDQAYDLVDTHSLRGQGFHVGEVPGACFCCKFNDLVETVATLNRDQAPDVIITEPVGSCTDLVATVIEPLRHLHGNQYDIGPLAVLLKPEHGQKILRQQGVGFSPKAAYIFLKQIEEADIVAVNKIDKLSGPERDELVRLVHRQFPGKEVLAVSARTGDGFQRLIEALSRPAAKHASMIDVDYDVYAEGEAELGWLNCQVQVAAADDRPFDLDALLVKLVSHLRDALSDHDAEPAHLKVLGQSGGASGIANLVGSVAEVELSLASEIDPRSAELIVNARVAADPERLESLVSDSIRALAGEMSLSHQIQGMQRFRPGRPVPTHRITSPSP